MSDVAGLKGAERVFADFGPIKVTSARFIVPQQTYVLAGITSVEFREILPDTKPLTYLGLGALLFLLVAIINSRWDFAFFSLIFALAGAGTYFQLKPSYSVILRTSGGEKLAHKSNSRKEVEDVIEALNEAIVYRST